jgi:hypothetical protein
MRDWCATDNYVWVSADSRRRYSEESACLHGFQRWYFVGIICARNNRREPRAPEVCRYQNFPLVRRFALFSVVRRFALFSVVSCLSAERSIILFRGQLASLLQFWQGEKSELTGTIRVVGRRSFIASYFQTQMDWTNRIGDLIPDSNHRVAALGEK